MMTLFYLVLTMANQSVRLINGDKKVVNKAVTYKL